MLATHTIRKNKADPMSKLKTRRDSSNRDWSRDEREKGESRDDRLTRDNRMLHPKNIVVLSFRNLQLRRISELQDDLLRLAVETASDTVPDDKTKEVDEKLRAYCESAIISALYNLLT